MVFCFFIYKNIIKQFFVVFLKACGAVPSPFDCYLVLRGLKTLPLRMKAHMENGIKVAQWLETNPRVERVVYPRKFISLKKKNFIF